MSGQSDHDTIRQSIGPTHQYLAKPCDPEELRLKLVHCFTLRDLLDNLRIKELVCGLTTVPSLPSLHGAITQALRAPDPSLAEVGSIIARDLGMAAKVLQLVNSAFFGLYFNVTSPVQAAALIGIDNLRTLVLSDHVFSELESAMTHDLACLWTHSSTTATCARAIAQSQDGGPVLADDAYTADLLHDVGRLVLASACSAEYEHVRQLVAERGIGISASEHEVFGCNHAAVGAYLLGLWGLPDSIVEAVAWHHEPARAGTGFSPAIAVHVADHYDHLTHSNSEHEKPLLDEALLAQLGLQDRLPMWTKACQELELRG